MQCVTSYVCNFPIVVRRSESCNTNVSFLDMQAFQSCRSVQSPVNPLGIACCYTLPCMICMSSIHYVYLHAVCRRCSGRRKCMSERPMQETRMNKSTSGTEHPAPDPSGLFWGPLQTQRCAVGPLCSAQTTQSDTGSQTPNPDGQPYRDYCAQQRNVTYVQYIEA